MLDNVTVFRDGIVIGDKKSGVELYINDFIQYIFNTFNGRINICNPATLQISYMQKGRKIGETLFPNIVIIYITTIIETSDTLNEVLTLITETIIHELYHVDQEIKSVEINDNPLYVRKLEVSVEFMTNSFIMNNIDGIVGMINTYLNCNMISKEDITRYIVNYTDSSIYNESFENWYQYSRSTELSHIMLSIYNMIGKQRAYIMINELKEFINNGYDIKFVINGLECDIVKTDDKGNRNLIDLNVFNEYIYEAYFKYTNHTLSTKDIYIEFDEPIKNLAVFHLDTIKDSNTMAIVV